MREAQLRAADQSLVAILVVFGAVCLVGFAVFLAFWQDNKREVRLDPPHAFAHIASLAGPGAIDCGRVGIADDPARSIQCVEAAIRDRKSFWMARRNSFHPATLMELHWYGFVRNAQGRQYVVIYYPPGAMVDDGIGSISTYGCPRIETRLPNGDAGPKCVGGSVGPPYWYRCGTPWRPGEEPRHCPRDVDESHL